MTQRITGRHRRPGRLSAASTTLTRSAAIAATSTGLLAGTAVTAGAAPSFVQDNQSSAGKGAEALVRLGQAVQDRTVLTDRPAKAAPALDDASPASFGTRGFTAFTPAVEPEVEETAAAPAQTQASAAVETRSQEPSASRTNERTEPVQQASTERAEPVQQQAPVEQSAPAPQPAAPAPVGGGVLSVAAAYTGIPYVYGGSTPSGFDCSGYTSFVFRQALGIELPRSAAGQQSYATPVSNPQPGDLVFFGYPAYHVGIYAGDGMMYDSGRPGVPTQYRAVFGGVSGYGRVG